MLRLFFLVPLFCAMVLVPFFGSLVSAADYEVSSSKCKMIKRNFHGMFAKDFPRVFALSQDGKYCGACLSGSKASRLDVGCFRQMKKGISDLSKAAIAACEDHAKRYGQADAGCKVTECLGC